LNIFITAIVITGLLLLTLFMGIQVWAALSFIGVLGFLYFLPFMQGIIGTISFNAVASASLPAIPLFLFMGEVIANSGLSKSLYRSLQKILGKLPGGVLYANIIACAIFAAISGSSAATASTFGTLAYKEQKEMGYPPSLISGTLAAGGTLGILIPPSITMLVYASMTNQSAAKLFIAGIIPGILMTLIFSIYIFVYSIYKRNSFKDQLKIVDSGFQIRDIPGVLKDIWPFFLIITTIIYGIYAGIMTPTEAAALSVVEAILITFLKKKLNLNLIKNSALAALKTNAMIIIIYIGAQIFGNFISMIKLPANICILVQNMELTKFYVFLIVTIMYLILGSLMEALSSIIITLPITYPLMVGFMKFDPIWFGIYLVIMNQIGLITHPIGINSYIIYGISGEKSMGIVFKGVIPFVIMMIIFVFIILIYPDIVLYLPNSIYQ